MKSQSKELKKILARKMANHSYRPQLYGKRSMSKEMAHKMFKAMVDKKKLPVFEPRKRDNSDYRKMSIEEFEKKYS